MFYGGRHYGDLRAGHMVQFQIADWIIRNMATSS